MTTERRRAQLRAACKRWRKKAYTIRPELALYYNARQRATAMGLPFDVSPDDLRVPAFCPVLGIPLSNGIKKLHAGSPTVDRFYPERGYVRGNVFVISHRANTIKQNASADELDAVARWIRIQERQCIR